MISWRSPNALENSVVDWLLGEDQPSVRYLTLTELLGRSHGDSDVMLSRENITNSGWARDILTGQASNGCWAVDETPHARNGRPWRSWPKYTSTNWMLLILSDLGLTKDEPRIEKACRTWMKRYDMKDGGFNDEPHDKEGHLCITGNTARALVKFGYVDHPRVRRAFEWLVRNQAEGGGWDCFHRRGTLDSWEPLSAFAVYPREKWTRSMKHAVERGAEFFLERQLHRQESRYEPWYRFHYPVHYYYDLLVGLDFMTALGYSKDKRLGYAVRLLGKKRRADGRWNLDAINPEAESPQGKWDESHPNEASIPFTLEKAGEPSKMITLRAMNVLHRLKESEVT